MKKTGLLETIGDFRIPANRIVLNPNDAYDLDMLTKDAAVTIYAALSENSFSQGEGLIANGSIVQDNACKLGTVQLNVKVLRQLGKPRRVMLILDAGRLLIRPC